MRFNLFGFLPPGLFKKWIHAGHSSIQELKDETERQIRLILRPFLQEEISLKKYLPANGAAMAIWSAFYFISKIFIVF